MIKFNNLPYNKMNNLKNWYKNVENIFWIWIFIIIIYNKYKNKYKILNNYKNKI
jgi:hypothetical protein